MKITGLTAQIHNPERVNVSIDGKYRCSLDIAQITDLGVKLGREVTEEELAELEIESQFGKLYSRALEYALMRPHSVREVRDYLHRKTLASKYRDKKGEVREKQGYSPALSERVLSKLQQKGYVDDEKFAKWWAESRKFKKGTSLRGLKNELQQKGITSEIVDRVLAASERSDDEEVRKIIDRKRGKYDDQKLTEYLLRQGFSYDVIRSALDD